MNNKNIVYFKNFINENKFSYITDKDFLIELEEIVKPFMINKIKKIDEINIYYYIDNDFINENIWDNILQEYRYENNIYGLVDKNLTKNNFKTSEIRNSLYKIMKKYYKKYNIKKLLNNKLIDIIENDPEKYGYILYQWKTEIDESVKKSLEWVKTYKKYNL